MRVSPQIHLVASGNVGFSLTDKFDCNAWLIETGDGLVLFDAGAGRDIASIFAELTTNGLDPADIKHIFLTHAHADHSGGVAPILDQLSRPVTLYAGEEAAARMQSHDETRISLDTARRFGVYPESYRWQGATVDTVLADDAVIHIGEASIRLLKTPGHSADHCSYLVTLSGKTMLVSGDALFAGGTVFLQDIPDCSFTATIATVRRLSNLTFDMFLPGHGAFALKEGMRHVRRAADFAERGLAPPNFGG
ncbi:MBL fold metallo-hydrolase [Acidisoma cellulosilytica]|uniref:MBL fold metallo-hydrolase n=1 Tax=Acidisoma cellulosilyticum TaxID=2802395 RepID=A0A963Z2B0_9PROT|nr:MBL fold metallo-hydrolase [Acidisoma cellulosilyticum]MCB8881229.1 MBL fold metallo-hydrolase [Acidisoma cellulosilyticum]